jgi:hypothetical protein
MAEKKEEKKEEKKGKKHLHEIRTTAAEDGTYVHHHTYKAKKEDAHAEPERQNVATSGSPEEAGEHTADQFAMNQAADQGGGGPDTTGGDPSADGGAAPDPGGVAAA